MGRLLDWPRGLGILSWSRLSGPRTEGAASTESLSGFVQTVSSVFGVWVYQISITALRGRRARLYGAMVEALHGGANAVRVPFNDPNIMTFKEAGINISDADARMGVPWSNTLPWSNGCNWQLSRPHVGVVADAAKGATVIELANAHWGYGLLGGEWLGFYPFHFGKYKITQVLGDGQYRVWPPLRKALVADATYATLNPVMVMRLRGESAGTMNIRRGFSEGNTLTLVEVTDEEARSFFAD